MKSKINKFQTGNKLNGESNYLSTSIICKQEGFTLIELLVATAISIIVLLAASSTFITTYRLNQDVKKRINYEQDVRNTGDLLRTDSRQLGNFGCMKEPSPNDLTMFNGAFNANNKQFISTSDFNIPGVTKANNIKSLLITYIDGKYANSITGDKCNTAIPSIQDNINGSVYVVGTTEYDDVQSLYKIDYRNKSWTEPQLVVKNVQNMSLTFNYDKHDQSDCPQNANSPELAPSLEISTTGDILTNYERPPVLIEAKLTVCPSGQYKSDGSCKESTTDYIIKSMVRKGEVCS